jgi:hypothetical protein
MLSKLRSTLNWIRAIATWTAFGLFLTALVDLL